MTRETAVGATPAPVDLDYDEIEAAVMESERGRWFLGEFARRNRHADTERLLSAIRQIEESMAARPTVGSSTEAEGMRRAVFEMAEEIASAKREIAAIRTPDSNDGDISDATAELDAIVTSTETATSDILGAAEQIQELAWTLREEGTPDAYCDALDERATEIYTACSFQDITGQRTTKVVRVLQMLDARINTMAELWSGGTVTTQLTKPAGTKSDEAHLLNGPALDGAGVDQDEIDRMMAEENSARDDAAPDEGDAEVANADVVPEPEMAADEMFDAVIDEMAEATDEPANQKESPVGAAEDGPDLDQLTRKDYEALFS